MIVHFALVFAAAPFQDKPDHSGLPLLKQAMQLLQEGRTTHITGSRFLEFSATEREYEGDYNIVRRGHSHLRYLYSNFWGDTAFQIVVNPKGLFQTDIYGATAKLEAPVSWASRQPEQGPEEFGGLIVSFLAPESELAKFVDLSKPITLKTSANEAEFTHISGSKHSVRIRPDKSIEIRTQQPGFPGFQPPYYQLDVFRIQAKDVKYPDSLFETPPNPKR